MPFDRMLTGMGWGDRVLGGAQPGKGGTGLGGTSLGRANVVLVLGVWFKGVSFHGQFFGFNTRSSEKAMLASNNFTAAKKVVS